MGYGTFNFKSIASVEIEILIKFKLCLSSKEVEKHGTSLKFSMDRKVWDIHRIL